MNFPLNIEYRAISDDLIKNDVSPEKAVPDISTKRVLVIDNNDAILEVMKIIITEAGYIFLPPLPAFVPEKISDLHPDLILIEDQLYNLPQGRKISQSLKRSALTSSIPVVMMTTVLESKDLISESEADTLLIKPFDIKSLEAILYRCAKRIS